VRVARVPREIGEGRRREGARRCKRSAWPARWGRERVRRAHGCGGCTKFGSSGMGETTAVVMSGRPVPSSKWHVRPITADSHPSAPPTADARLDAPAPLQVALVRAPLLLRHGDWAAIPLRTVPTAAPAIPARPFRLQDPLRLLSGRLNGCGTETGTISRHHAALSKARAALARRPPCT